MKSLVSLHLLFMAFVLPLAAQEREEGVGICYFGEGNDILYVTHKTYPFGTKLIVTNPVTQANITVQVGGRLEPSSFATIEISERAAELLGMNSYYPTWLWLKAVRENTPRQHVQRPRLGMFKQAGNATVTAGNDFTASHSSLPLGTRLRITNPANGKFTNITVTNRIRPSRERVIEISKAVAQRLSIRGASALVRLESTDNK